MSSESIAALRKTAGDDFAAIAENHIQHDLQQSDREALESAASRLSTYASVGSVIGLGLSVALAYRVRSLRTKTFTAFRAMEKPTHVQFAGGRSEPVPDITNLMRPTTIGDFATYTFFAAGGLFIGGELGALGGSLAASRSLNKDPEAKQRIETAFRRFRADILRKEAESLERGEHSVKGF